MRADTSAYAVLGLEPDADRAAIERAYKRLIKQHHPDREGGDSARAAEINRAYRELRVVTPREQIELDPGQPFGTRPSAWTLVAILAAVASLALVVATGWMMPGAAPMRAMAETPASAAADVMEQPIHLPEVDEEIRHAVGLSQSEGEPALAEASRACHQQLRQDPSLQQLDRCAAFDSSVILLQDRDPMRDRGPFSELAVTSRLMRGGSYLSSDYLAIDGRLDQIRLRAELALTPRVEPPPPPPPEEEAEAENQS